MTVERSHCRLLHLITILMLSSSVTTYSQFTRLSNYSHILTQTNFSTNTGLYSTNYASTWKYDPNSRQWIEIAPHLLLATYDSTFLYRLDRSLYLHTQDLGRTFDTIDIPTYNDYQHFTWNDTIVVRSSRGIYAKTEPGKVPWRRIDTDTTRQESLRTARMHRFGSSVILWQDYEIPNICSYSLSGQILPIASANSIRSVSSIEGFVLFNYGGRLSFTPTSSFANRFNIGADTTVLCRLGSALVAIGANGLVAVTRDTGRTWQTNRSLPAQSLAYFQWFSHRDSLYVKYTTDDTWYATDSTFLTWSAISLKNPYHGSQWTVCDDNIVTWWSNSLVSSIDVTSPAHVTIRVNEGPMPVGVVTTDQGTLVRFAEDRMYRSRDCGVSWDLTVLPRRTLMAGYSSGRMWLVDGGLHVSIDEGATWNTIASVNRRLTRNSVSIHSDSYVFADESGFYVSHPQGGSMQVTRPGSSVLSSYARFGDTSYIATPQGMFYLSDGHWIYFTSAPDDVQLVTLRPHMECYYGFDTAWRPIRWRPGGDREQLDTARFRDGVLTVSGQYVMFSSEEYGAFVHRHTPVTSIPSPNLRPDRYHIVLADDREIDLERYSTNPSGPPPNVTVFGTTGNIVYQQQGSWSLSTSMLARGMYVARITHENRSTTIVMHVVH